MVYRQTLDWGLCIKCAKQANNRQVVSFLAWLPAHRKEPNAYFVVHLTETLNIVQAVTALCSPRWHRIRPLHQTSFCLCATRTVYYSIFMRSFVNIHDFFSSAFLREVSPCGTTDWAVWAYYTMSWHGSLLLVALGMAWLGTDTGIVECVELGIV